MSNKKMPYMLLALCLLFAGAAQGFAETRMLYVGIPAQTEALKLFTQELRYVSKGEAFAEYAMRREIHYKPATAVQEFRPTSNLRCSVAQEDSPVDLAELTAFEADRRGFFYLAIAGQIIQQDQSRPAPSGTVEVTFPVDVQGHYLSAVETEDDQEPEVEEVDVAGKGYLFRDLWAGRSIGRAFMVFADKYAEIVSDIGYLTFTQFLTRQSSVDHSSHLLGYSSTQSRTDTYGDGKFTALAVERLKLSAELRDAVFAGYSVTQDNEIVLVSRDGALNVKLYLAQQ